MARFTDKTLHPRARDQYSIRCGYLVGVFGDYGMGLNQTINGKGCLVGPHGENTVPVTCGEIRLVEFTLSGHSPIRPESPVQRAMRPLVYRMIEPVSVPA